MRNPVMRDSFLALLTRGSMLAGRGLGLILISRRLGSEGFGIYALVVFTFSVFVCLGTFGTEQANLYLAGRRARRVPVLVGNAMALAGLLGAATAVLFPGVVALLHERIYTGAPAGAIVLSALALPLGILHNALSGVLVGLGRFRYLSWVEVCKWCAYLCSLGVLYRQDTLAVTTALACHYAVLGIAGLVHVAALCAGARALPRLQRRLLLPTLSMGRRMLFVHLTGVVGLRLDVYTVRLSGSVAAVGPYALATHLSEIVLHMAKAFSQVVFSGTARGSSPASLRVGTLLRLLLGAAACVGLLGRESVLVSLFGETGRDAGAVLFLRLPGVLALALTQIAAGELLGRGRTDAVSRGNVLAVVVLSLLAAPFGAWIGPAGAAAGFSIAALTQVAWITAALRSVRAGVPFRPAFSRALGLSLPGPD